MTMESVPLGAIVYEPHESCALDGLLRGVAHVLKRSGCRLAGAVQHNTERAARCRCDMALEDLASGRIIEISEDRGSEARGCRLDHRSLEDIVGLSGSAVARGVDLLVINKFGKREVAGHGFMPLIHEALDLGTPVLLAVSTPNLAAWDTFAAGLDHRLPPALSAVLHWATAHTDACRRSPSSAASRG